MNRSRFAARVCLLLMASMAAFAILASSELRETAAKPVDPELARAQSLLSQQIDLHPILAGVTVEIRPALQEQAIAHYREGRIVVSDSHTASLDKIIEHEVWHVIDWRDNHRIDWGENVPRG